MTRIEPVPGSVAGSVAAVGGRLVRQCRCGGLYVNPDAHRDAFGHHPEPVTGNAFRNHVPPPPEAPGRRSVPVAA